MTTLNTGAVTPAVRKPNFRVLVNGTACAGFLAFDVTNNTHYGADTYTLTAAINGLPNAMNAAWWYSGQPAMVEILADDSGGGSYVSLITGDVDTVECDWVAMTMTLTGRDLSARLVDTASATSYTGQKAADIVRTIAANHGLTANAQDVGGYVGATYGGNGRAVLYTQDQSEWDLLVSLAQQVGFDLWVSGTTLNFQPPADLTTSPYLIQRNQDNSGNYLRLRTMRTLPLGRPVTVQVSTWNQTAEMAISHAYQAIPMDNVASGSPQIYKLTTPNDWPVNIQQMAQTRLEEITQHERTVDIELPADNSVTVRTPFKIVGTQGCSDQTYRLASVQRCFSFSGGYTMALRLKNHSPQTVSVVS